ncbi:MAG: dienelactone hydrolase family protein [Gammaproteobacteria bacterium]|nr:dienelactone hydrolase family protein [Gammaproteobacteria bacterium]
MTAGEALSHAAAAMILVHGRGANAADILTLAEHIGVPGFAYLAPQAAQYTWYPQSFMAALDQNEPHLSSALETIAELVAHVLAGGIPAEKIIIGGFSQGACLTSEFAARNPKRYGGLIVLSGGLIGPPNTARNYTGTFNNMPVFLGCSNIDIHIPEERVHESAQVLEKMGAQVVKRIYPDMGHTIIGDEIEQAKNIVKAVAIA